MTPETLAIRTQILANCKIMLKNSARMPPPRNQVNSQATLVNGLLPYQSDLEIVVSGVAPEFTGLVMVGLTPAIEGPSARTIEGALRKLLFATCELLHNYVSKVGAHQRNIHGGGGVYDSDMIVEEFADMANEARKGSVVGS